MQSNKNPRMLFMSILGHCCFLKNSTGFSLHTILLQKKILAIIHSSPLVQRYKKEGEHNGISNL